MTTTTNTNAQMALCFCGLNHCGRTAAQGCETTNRRKAWAAAKARKAAKAAK
jgi:hypothetical protein